MQAQATSITFKADRVEAPGAETWIGALAASALALVVLLFLVRRYLPVLGRIKNRLPATLPAVQVLGAARLNAQVQLAVVEFGTKQLLLAVTLTSVSVLETAELPRPTGGTP